MNPNRLLTHSLRASPHGELIAGILAAALVAVDPAAAVRRFVQRDGDVLTIGALTYDLTAYDRVLLVGMGKAGAPMAHALEEVLGDRLSDGVVVVKEGHSGQHTTQRYRLIEAGHPIPDARGVEGARQIAALLAETTERDLVLAVISGGGSALLTLPAPGISLADLQGLTRTLLGCGATINELNTLRKHLDLVKGGGLARMAQPAALATLILSDVVGNPLDVIASGPTVPDTSNFRDAYAILERYGVVEQIPSAILEHLRRGIAGEIADTPKPGEPLFAQVQNVIVASNVQAAEAALEAARAAGLNTLLLTSYVQGEAREVARVMAALAREIADSGRPIPRPACLVAGGETTVTLRGDGLGGRNQELALAAAADLAGLDAVYLVTLATDGGDGPTDAAGAVVTGESLARMQQQSLDAAAALARNDSYHLLAALGDLLQPGPTQTNVNDLTFIFAL